MFSLLKGLKEKPECRWGTARTILRTPRIFFPMNLTKSAAKCFGAGFCFSC